MSANLQLDSRGRLVHLLTTEGLPRELVLHILDTASPAGDSRSTRAPGA